MDVFVLELVATSTFKAEMMLIKMMFQNGSKSPFF